MKRNLQKYLPLFTLLCGAVGLLLRFWLFATGLDEKGLLVTGHPANTLIYIVAALFMAALFLAVRPLGPMDDYSKLFPVGATSLLGCVAAALGLIYAAFRELTMRRDPVTMMTLVLAVAAAVCLILLGNSRKIGKRPHYLLRTVLTVYLMLHLISQYRLWSAEPQLQYYFFQLLASVLLMLTAYHGTVLDAKTGSRRWYVFCNQAALFCCCLSLQGDSWLFYLTMGIYTATTVCDLQMYPAHPVQEA